MTKPALPPCPFRSAVKRHLVARFGRPTTVFTPCDPTEPIIGVAEFAPRPGTEAWTYVTVGMSSWPQRLPSSPPAWLSPRVELLTYVPERCRWPVEVLNLVGRLPVEQKSWLFWWHTVDCGGPLDECADTTQTAVLLLPPYFEAEGFDELVVDGEAVRFLMAVAITDAERLAALARGGQALEEQLLTEHVDVVFRRSRPSVF